MTIATYPLTILADDREKAPYTFDGLGETYVVRARLEIGDYSLPFLQLCVAVSRKTMADLYDTLLDAERTARFEHELERMDFLHSACVIVEGHLDDDPPFGRNESDAFVVQRRVHRLRGYTPSVNWLFVSGRRGGEILTYAFLLAFRERAEMRRDQEGAGSPDA